MDLLFTWGSTDQPHYTPYFAKHAPKQHNNFQLSFLSLTIILLKTTFLSPCNFRLQIMHKFHAKNTSHKLCILCLTFLIFNFRQCRCNLLTNRYRSPIA